MISVLYIAIFNLILSNISDGADLGTLTDVGTIDGKNILIGDQTLNFYQSMRLCAQIGGELLTIENEEQSDLVTTYLNNNGLDSLIWVGGWRLGEDGTTVDYFYWLSTGVEIDTGYTNWVSGQPDNVADNACLALWYDFAWGNFPCSSVYYPMCEVALSSDCTT